MEDDLIGHSACSCCTQIRAPHGSCRRSYREGAGDAPARDRTERNIGPLRVTPALMCGGSERPKAAQLHRPHETPAENVRDLPSLSSQWLEGSAVGNEAAGLGYSRPTVPPPITGEPLLRCVKACPKVPAPMTAHFAQRRAKCALRNPGARPHDEDEEMNAERDDKRTDDLLRALTPFAAAAPAFANHGDTTLVLGTGRLTAGDFRRAAEAINPPAQPGKQEDRA